MKQIFLGLLFLSWLVPAWAHCGKNGHFDDCGEITAGRPKFWTLEEAHYIIEDIRGKLGELKVKAPADLDPNAVNQRSLDILQSMFQLSAQFDQAEAVKNRASLEKYQTERQEALENRAEAQRIEAELSRLNTDLEALNTEAAALNKKKLDLPPEPKDAIDKIEHRLAVIAIDQEVLQKRIDQRQARLTDLRARSTLPEQPNVTATAAAPMPTTGNLPAALINESSVKEALAADLKKILDQDPQLHYSQQLGNLVEAHLQLLSRRLTVLRESLDPHYDLLFLELSSSITPARGGKHHIAMVRWEMKQVLETRTTPPNTLRAKVTAPGLRPYLIDAAERYYIPRRWFPSETDTTLPEAGEGPLFETQLAACITARLKTLDVEDSQQELWRKALAESAVWKKHNAHAESEVKQEQDAQFDSPARLIESPRDYCRFWQLTLPRLVDLVPGDSPEPNCRAPQELGTKPSQKVDRKNECHPEAAEFIRFDRSIENFKSSDFKDSTRQPYIFELSPAQSALNIANTNATVSNVNLLGVVKTLVGWGLQTNYQRQHEQYSKFLTQRVFVAGFGKGENVFGWDFAPMAGEDFVSPGNYTTYAVAAIPQGADRKLLFRPSVGWYEQPEMACRKQRIPTVGNTRDSLSQLAPQLVRIPENLSYFLTAMDYAPVDPGGYITIFLRGLQFPSETTVLVNNVALTKRGHLPRPDLPSGSANPSTDVNGDYEVVSGDTIVMRFTCGPGFSGVPEISLVTPSRSVDVNRLPLLINRVFSRLDNYNDPLLKATVLPFFRPNTTITRVDYLDVDSSPQHRVTTRLSIRDLPPRESPYVIKVRQHGTWVDTHAIPEDSSQPLLSDVSSEQPLRLEIVGKSGKLVAVHSEPIPFRPIIKNVQPPEGQKSGDVTVTITGENLSEVESVDFGGQPGLDLKVVSDSQLRVRVPTNTSADKVLVRATSRLAQGGKKVSSVDEKFYSYK